MRKVLLIILSLLIPAIQLSAQTDKEKAHLRQERFSKIDYMHAAIGLETGGNRNFVIGPKASYGIGSFRNLLNGEVGFGYMFYNSFGSSSSERITLHQVPLFADVHLNFARWKAGALYLGGEAAIAFTAYARHKHPSSEIEESNSKLGRTHASLGAMLGLRLSRWDISVRYCYDLAPMMNQKLVFETDGYDYDLLHDSLFERSRILLNISYLIPF